MNRHRRKFGGALIAILAFTFSAPVAFASNFVVSCNPSEVSFEISPVVVGQNSFPAFSGSCTSPSNILDYDWWPGASILDISFFDQQNNITRTLKFPLASYFSVRVFDTGGSGRFIADIGSSTVATMSNFHLIMATALAIPMFFVIAYYITELFPVRDYKHIVKPQKEGYTVVLGD